MNRFTIFCTPKQAKKALELGAPIKTVKTVRTKNTVLSEDIIEYDEDTFTYAIPPTAEEMEGWLLENGITLCITVLTKNIIDYALRKVNERGTIDVTCRSSRDYSTLKEATLAAISTALDYLT